MIGPRHLLVLASAALVGCGNRVEHGASAVWSDDQRELLIVEQREEYRDGAMDTDVMLSADYRLWRFDVETGETHRWTGWRRGIAARAFYMRRAGYALLALRFVDASDQVVERVSVDGARSRMDSLPWETPSPDGALIAVTTWTCSEASAADLACTAGARFFDGSTLAELAPSGTFTFTTRTDPLESGYVSHVWTPPPQRDLIARARKVYRDEWLTPTFVLRSGAEPEEVPDLPCDPLEPETSSGTISADGRRAAVDVVDGELRVNITPSTEIGWPERCFPGTAL